MPYIHKVEPGSSVCLADIDPNADGGLTEEEAQPIFLEMGTEVADLQSELYATRQNSVLMVLQGLDTSGKDGAIRNVLQNLNPQGCVVESFRTPTEEEADHDFLWRAHRVTPRKGCITVFNRSYYEDVLIVRVRELASPEIIEERYGFINDFERLLVASGTLVLKFFLYISRDEQERRLLAREARVEKAWKISISDWQERQFWDEYVRAYEDAVTRCSTPHAPWYIVPANHKWFRNLAVRQTLLETLRSYRPTWEAAMEEIREQRIRELNKLRETQK